MGYLLLESGGRLLLEDGGGLLLEDGADAPSGSLVGGNLAAIETGPCALTFRGTLVGHTVGGCTLAAKPNTRSRMVDEYGENSVETIHQGDAITVKVTLAEKSYDTLQTVYMYGAAMGGNAMGFGRRPGTRISTLASQLIIHPLAAGDSTADDVIVSAAAVIDVGDTLIGVIESDMVFEVTFGGMLNTALSDGAMLGYIGTSEGS